MEAEHKEESTIHVMNHCKSIERIKDARRHTETQRNLNICIMQERPDVKQHAHIYTHTDRYVNVNVDSLLYMSIPCEFECIFSYYEGFVINESASVADLPPSFLGGAPRLVPELVAEFGWQRMVLWMDL